MMYDVAVYKYWLLLVVLLLLRSLLPRRTLLPNIEASRERQPTIA